MATTAIQPRYPTAAAIERLTAMLHLPPGGQDWEIEVADADRVGEFLDSYERQPLEPDDRFALMALIVASYDDHLRGGGDADGRVWDRLRRHLLGDFGLHGYTVQYWSLPDGDYDPDHVFAFTGRAREVMAAVYGPRERWPRRPSSVKTYTDRPDPVVPDAPLNAMDISDERDGSFALWWSKFGDRPCGERRGFATVDDAVAFAAREFGVAAERWKDV